MVKIISDSTCDLTDELIEKYDIGILPLHILLGDEEYEDRCEITPEQIYEWADANKTTPKTSAPGFDRAVDMLRPYAEAKQEVVCLAISEDISASANVMRLATEELEAEERITVINTESLSTGLGLLVIEAAIMAKEGKTAKEITDRVKELIPYVRTSFVVDTLVYLHRGGRCSGLTAMAGGVLKIHPKIAMANGKLNPDKKYRGKMKSVVMSYVKDMEAELKNAKPDRVFITHSCCEQELLDDVKAYLESLGVFEEIHITTTGGVISSHCGPGTLGVLFISK